MRHKADNNQAADLCGRVEEALRGQYARRLFKPFARAVAQFRLVEEGDKIAVCISGGKDSMLMAKLFQELKRHNKFPFELLFLVMDPGYAPENVALIKENAEKLNIPITLFSSNIFENVTAVEKSPCYLCARMRRGFLYAKAQQLGCNKIALGHHYDDVIETILMGMLYGGQIQTMLPRLKSTNFAGMSLIRPMYFVRERDILSFRDEFGLRFLRCACNFTAELESGEVEGKRKRVKELIALLAREDRQVEQNIFKSVENVNLRTVMAYKDENGERHSVLEEEV